MVEGALVVALSVALSYVKIWRMPQGGSITIENVPLLLFALRYGFRWGIGAGAVSGLLQLALGGYIVHPAQALLDYPLAFGALGTAALLRTPLWAGICLGTAVRLFCHVFSGALFFASYAPEGTSIWLYSITYNGSFMLPSLVLSILLVYLLWPRLGNLDQGERG